MTTPPSYPVTKLLAAVGQGDESARDRLWSVIYDELHGLARQQMADEAPGRTLQPTALVHEAYLRLMGGGNVQWSNRRHFFAAAAQAMRRIRIDDARRRGRLKRGGDQRPRTDSRSSVEGTEKGFSVQHDSVQAAPRGLKPADHLGGAAPRGLKPAALPVEEVAAPDQDPAEVLAVDEALGKLEQTDPRAAEVVLLRFFAGLTVAETADAMGLSARTVDRDWCFARAWFHRELSLE